MSRNRFIVLFLFLLPAIFSAALFAQNPQVVLETNFGNIVIELYPEDAPITVDNFLSYVNRGFYDGIVFHRAIDGFMIQAGAYYTKGYTIYYKDPLYAPIINEGDNGLRNVRGTISTALKNTPDTATSQFFINQVDNPHLDFDYPDGNGFGHCVFGSVLEGMDIVDEIASVPTCYINPSLANFPCDPPVFIHTAYELPCSLSYCSDVASQGKISFEDFAVFALHWLATDCGATGGFCDGADLDYSGSVDITDIELFWNNWTRVTGYEHQFSDLFSDYTIDMIDLSNLMDRWLDSDCRPDNNYCDNTDINRDGKVDFIDFSVFANNWLISY